MTIRTPSICTPLWAERLALLGTPARHTGMGRGVRTDGPVLVAGLAGGLAPQVRPGDVVVASQVRDGRGVLALDSAPLLAGALRRSGFRVHVGPVVTVGRVVDGPARTELAATGALAVDTESAHLVRGAGAQPAAVVRVVVDTAAHPLYHPGTLIRGARALTTLRRMGPVLAQWVAATGEREIRLAEPRSFCAGVERAVEIVERALQQRGAPVYVRRQIVHNTHVVARLESLGAVFVTELDEVPIGASAVLAAHGVAPEVRHQAAERRLRLVDATCPLVSKVHHEVRRHAARGDTVLLIGHREHEEVVGTVGQVPGRVVVVPDAEEAARVQVPDPGRVAYAMQTTLALDEAAASVAVLRERFPELRAPRRDDICYATTNRQQAVRAVAARAELVLVVGSATSSNSLRLVEVAARAGAAAHLVEDAGQVEPAWLVGIRRVGITAGASAPPHLVEELVRALAGLGAATVDEHPVVHEDLRFTLPKEVS